MRVGFYVSTPFYGPLAAHQLAVVEGLRDLGHQVVLQNGQYFNPRDQPSSAFDLVVCHGLRGSYGAAAVHWRALGKPVIVLDLAPLLREAGFAYLGYWWVNWMPPVSCNASRLVSCGIADLYAPRESVDECEWDVLILGQVEGDSAHRMSASQLRNEYSVAADTLQSHGANVIFRPHPNSFSMTSVPDCHLMDPAVPLREAILSARTVATINSSTGNEALLLGVPVLQIPAPTYLKDFALPYGRLTSTIMGGWQSAEPPSEDELISYFSRLAYTLWNVDELRSGAAFKALLDEGFMPDAERAQWVIAQEEDEAARLLAESRFRRAEAKRSTKGGLMRRRKKG